MPPTLGIFRGALNPAGIDAFSQWLGRPVDLAGEFDGSESWDNLEGPSWLLNPWAKWVTQKPGRQLILAVPMLAGPWGRTGPTAGTIDKGEAVSLEKGATGAYNHHFAKFAEALVSRKMGNTIIRLGWEFNGGWYGWRAKENPGAFSEYWRQIVKTMHAVKGAEGLKFCWNPANGYQAFPAEQAWPGDDWVDYIGVDVYDQSWLPNTYPWPAGEDPVKIEERRHKVWDQWILNYSHGLAFWAKFATEHKKPLAIPEWGVSSSKGNKDGLDNAYFVEQMHSFIMNPANRVAFHVYFDIHAHDGNHQISPGNKGPEQTEFPLASKKYLELFKGP
ncbi:MAG: glycosyl hydrolase [Chthoniobacter sp.]|uniref:glycoside hydrolase family 26 protein n=1 Tax=Chthoniobacter sp. TaxID=2510640 RepID=UPI0032AA51B3